MMPMSLALFAQPLNYSLKISCLHPRILSHASLNHGHTTKLSMSSFGLTDDGDFAILGVNVQDPDEDENPTNAGQNVGGDISSLLAGTFLGASKDKSSTIASSIDWQNVGTPSATSSYVGVQQGSVSNNNRLDNTNLSMDEEAFADIMEYLMEIMPTISEDDVERYSVGLINIGFHPKCVTMCELKLEDLDFMKVLHRRYFFNEVTGVEHPWEV
jgi:hypothetical protein